MSWAHLKMFLLIQERPISLGSRLVFLPVCWYFEKKGDGAQGSTFVCMCSCPQIMYIREHVPILGRGII